MLTATCTVNYSAYIIGAVDIEVAYPQVFLTALTTAY